MKLRFGLSLKLILLNFVTLFFSFVIVIYISNKSFENTLHQSIGNGLAMYANETALAIDNYIQSCIAGIRVISQADVFETVDPEAMTQYLKEIAQESSQFQLLLVVNKTGEVITSSGTTFKVNVETETETETEAKAIMKALLHSPLFEKLSSAKQGEVFYDDQLRSGNSFFPILLTPLTDDTNTIVLGALIGVINTAFIEREVTRIDDRTIGEKAAFLVDDPGNVLISRDPGIKLFTPLSDIAANPKLKDLLEGDRSGFTEYIDHVGDRVIAGYSDLSEYGKNQGGDWSIISIAPIEEAMLEVGRVRKELVTIALVALFLGGLVAYYFSRGIVKSIQSLVVASANLAAGKQEAVLTPVESNDEIGDLSRAFYKMSEGLKKK